MPDREQGLGRNQEQSQGTVIQPTERGSERFPWKSLILTLGLTAAGVAIGISVFKPFDVSDATVGLRALAAGATGALGFATGIILTSGFNIFREDVADLRGHGEFHPKSPILLRRG